MKRAITTFLTILCSITMIGQENIDILKDGFENPPSHVRPQIWWHWMNGNITKDGIRKDIEWFKRIGLGGFHVFDASFSASCPHYLPELGEATPVCPIFMMTNSSGLDFIPTHYVDITEEMDLKHKMLACHESQIVWLKDHDGIDVIAKLDILSAFYGMQSGVQYAESFKEWLADGRQRTFRLLP